VSEIPNELELLNRQLRQRLESLSRAGLDRIPAPAMPPISEAPRARLPVPHPSDSAEEEDGAVVPPPPDKFGPVEARKTVAPPPVPVLGGTLFDIEEASEPMVPQEERPRRLAELRDEVAACQKCPLLVANRTQTVFGEGSPNARLMFVGEGPGETEDRTGRPFVGRAGQLLTDMITKGMGLAREDVYIANIVKSRPPDNREPFPEEVRNCLPYLERQIAIIRPQFLCILGSPAAKALLETAVGVTRLRSKWHRYRGIPTVVTFHPAYLLRNPASKKDTWEDLQMLMGAMGIKPPSRNRE
jgi:uracil-DNA glycosylase